MKEEEILDYEEKKVYTNFRKWGFRTSIILVLLAILLFFQTPPTISFSTDQELYRKLLILNWFLKIMTAFGLFCLIAMVKNQEPKDYNYWTTILTISILIVISIFNLLNY